MGSMLIFLVIFLAGGVIGFGVYHITLSKKRLGVQQQELEQAKAELEQYKSKVNNHFMDSAELMGKVASSYQALHSHMASQSQSLLSNEDSAVFPQLNTPLSQTQEKPMLTKDVVLKKVVDITSQDSSKEVVDSSEKRADNNEKAPNNDNKVPLGEDTSSDSREKTADNNEKAPNSDNKAPVSVEITPDSSEKSPTVNDEALNNDNNEAPVTAAHENKK
ncbi:MAG: uncharacterized membrane-anchored protein YhcB (DUF1043 family) [Glaciecola sp.]|jgi:uncharacterized membrane-anchored protein YhcB (DUF1043 family)